MPEGPPLRSDFIEHIASATSQGVMASSVAGMYIWAVRGIDRGSLAVGLSSFSK